MIKELLIITFLFPSGIVLAQKNSAQSNKKETLDNEQNRKAIGTQTLDLSAKLNGTFQIILSDSSHQFALNNDFLNWLDRSRKEDEDQYIEVDAFITIYLPSKKTITTNNFVPLVSTIVKN